MVITIKEILKRNIVQNRDFGDGEGVAYRGQWKGDRVSTNGEETQV